MVWRHVEYFADARERLEVRLALATLVFAIRVRLKPYRARKLLRGFVSGLLAGSFQALGERLHYLSIPGLGHGRIVPALLTTRTSLIFTRDHA